MIYADRGFIGPLLHDSGYHIVFADVNEELINNINEEGQWDVHILTTAPHEEGAAEDGVQDRELLIDDVSGVLSNSDEVISDIVRFFGVLLYLSQLIPISGI
jgi:mannitol-1-phosphate 5-dehydrogenase